MNTRIFTRPGRARGFTLVELSITMLIVGVLAAIATASYFNQVRKSRRTEAKTAILDLAGREERGFATLNAYSQTASQLGYTGTFPVAVGSGYYTINVTCGPAASNCAPTGAGVQATFTITATPVGDQTKDGQCTSFSVDQTGSQSATGTDAANCWR
jgi:type IV pilus assembly protein PilE